MEKFFPTGYLAENSTVLPDYQVQHSFDYVTPGWQVDDP